jgi:hypothetical protein
MTKKRAFFLRFVAKVFGVVILLFLVTELLFYFTAPVYDFPRPEPFSGDKLFNPYAGIDSNSWKKANFHFHTRAWSGLTSGRGNLAEDSYEMYRELGYDIIGISNYQSISTLFNDSSGYIPVYEHGFGFRKRHHIVIGAKDVLWYDYSLVQNLHNRQHILDLLRDRCEVSVIAHPDWENGFPPDQMRYLSNYDLIEVLDNNWRSVPQWDAALSSGHPVFILADDDAHDISNPKQVGVCCTFINSPSLKPSDIYSALKAGRAFCADIYIYEDTTQALKIREHHSIPKLKQVEVRGDTLFVATDSIPRKITFIGQNGVRKKVVYISNSAWYRFSPDDTYIRTEINYFTWWRGKGTTFYLNPVFRYNGEKPSNALRAEINWPRTWIFRIFTIPPMFILIYLVWYFRKKKLPKPNRGERA